MLAFSDLRRVTYCPRQLWYARRDDRSPPDSVDAVKEIANRYVDLLQDDPAAAGADCRGPPSAESSLATAPIEVAPVRWRERLLAASDRFDRFPDVVDPAGIDVFLAGRECHGVASKVLPDPPMPSLVSPGEPPEQGVWEPHAVWAVAASKALSWERERRIDEAFVEYPAYGVIRKVRLTTGKKAAYRAAIRTVRSLDGPPPRVDDTAKCKPCEYAGECGVATRTLRTRLADR